MQGNRHSFCSFNRLTALLIITAALSGCSVYTINKSDLEATLKPRQSKTCCNGKGLNTLISIYKKQYNNHMDTLACSDSDGNVRLKRFSYDSKVKIITKENKTIRYYAKTLYIWNDQFLIGERASVNLGGASYVPVKLTDIARIEVRR